MCKKRPSEASKTCSEHSENSVFQANMPKIVKNVAFTNVVKSFGDITIFVVPVFGYSIVSEFLFHLYYC